MHTIHNFVCWLKEKKRKPKCSESGKILHIQSNARVLRHCKICSAYQGVCLHFNENQGNGLFNLASEHGWIL